jgi:Terpene cyclase DEP1
MTTLAASYIWVKATASMTDTAFRIAIIVAAAVFLAIFALVVMPPFIAHPDVIGAFAAGFVNPYASGYSTDTLACWAILSAWILYERRTYGIRHGVWCIALGIIPGVAIGFALYLLLRMKQLGRIDSVADPREHG